MFWAIDGGVDMIKLFVDYDVQLDSISPKGWTALSYAKAKGKYGAVEEKGIYPEVRFPEACGSHFEEMVMEGGGDGGAMFFLCFF